MSKCVLDKIQPYKISLYRLNDNPKTSIYYYFRHNKIKYQGSTGSNNLDISRTKVIEIYFELTKGIRPKGRKKTVSFEDIVNSFLKYKKEHQLKDKTLVEYNRQSKYLLEWFKKNSKGIEINSFLSKSKYKSYCDWRRTYYEKHEQVLTYKRNGKKIEGRKFQSVGNTTLNRECRLLCSVLRHGKEHMGLFKDFQIPSYKMFPEKRRDVLLTRDEYLRLKDYWLNKDPYRWYILSFLNNTGIRWNELLKITWGDVFFEKSYVLIRERKNKNPNTVINTPVPIIGTPFKILETLKSREGISTNPNDLVFVDNKGRQIKSITKSFKKSLIECNVDKPFTIHGFRHLFTTRMVRRPDIPIKILSNVLGHTSVSTLERSYSHLRGEDYVKVFRESENHKQEILNGRKQNQIETTENTP